MFYNSFTLFIYIAGGNTVHAMYAVKCNRVYNVCVLEGDAICVYLPADWNVDKSSCFLGQYPSSPRTSSTLTANTNTKSTTMNTHTHVRT